jgi:uncharacterized membrane protein
VSGPVTAATLATALACALVGGVFFAFSSFVMPALGRLRPEEGIVAMQSINRVAVTPAFMAAFLGTALACVAMAGWAVISWGEDAAPWVVAGSALYLIGSIGLTAAYHVPRNDALEAVDPGDDDAPSRWARYLAEWTRWNHVRTAASVAGAAAFVVAAQAG